MGNETKMAASAAATAVKVGAHLTRNHFKRKIITAGVSIFATLAVSASGFAAWVLSSSAQKEDAGNVTVGVVEKSEIVITDLEFTGEKNFIFEPQASDITGRVRHSGEEGDAGENLTVAFTCNIENAITAANIAVEFQEPAAIKAAVQAGYLVSPNLGGVAKVALKTNGNENEELPSGWNYEEVDGVGQLSITLSYAWGATFNAKNPGIYYDTDEAGKLISDEEVERTLHTFKAVCHGMEYDAYMAWYNLMYDEDPNNNPADLEVPQYKVLISASA